jgi:hypothetical protein
MPVGQSFASHLIWRLHPTLLTVATTSRQDTPLTVAAFSPIVDLAGMRHPHLTVRLFIRGIMPLRNRPTSKDSHIKCQFPVTHEE